jgi:hypothetical protein
MNLGPAAKRDILTKDDHYDLFVLYCDMVAKALVGPSKVTGKELLDLGDYRFVAFMFNYISRKSGVSGHMAEDMERFFRDPGR